MTDTSCAHANGTLWTRPPGPLKVWEVIKGVKNRDNGELVTITIQEIPEDMYEDAIRFMTTYFISSEPMCTSCNSKDDPVFVSDFANVWRDMLKQGISIMALAENHKGGKPEIAGVSMLGVDFKEHGYSMDRSEFKSTNLKKMTDVVMSMVKEVNVYELYGINRYMCSHGLTVNPSYWGQSLGEHLLRTRDKIGREYRIPLAFNSYTSSITQQLATRIGYDVLHEKDFDQIIDEKGNPVLPGVKTKTLKLMAKRLY